MTPVSARVTAWVEEIAQAHAAAITVGLLTDEEHRARLEAEWAVLQRVPALLAVVRGVAELADQLDAEAEHCDVRAETYPPSGPWALEHTRLAVRARISRRAAIRLTSLLADAAPDTEKETDR